MDKSEWSTEIETELDFWEKWIATKGGKWPDDYSFRIQFDSVINEQLSNYIKTFFPPGDIDILDVGAGPLSCLGKTLNNYVINITAVDALANYYRELRFGFKPPVITEYCDSENLNEKFGDNRFHISHARNTLDHSYDPLKAIDQMIRVTKIGGLIITHHEANEALRANWNGFHKWNFYIGKNGFTLSSKHNIFNINELIKQKVKIVYQSEPNSEWIFTVWQKI